MSDIDVREGRPLWDAVARIVDGATVSGLLAHKLAAYGAFRLRELHQPVPAVLQYEERAASVNMLTVVPLLARIRDAADGPLVVLKGPEVARLYPGAARRFGDVDILTPQAEAVQQSLIRAGFVPSPRADEQPIPGHHHLQILRWPTIPLRVEVHSRPNWPTWAPPPPLSDLLGASVPGAFLEGVGALHPAHHALLIAAHSWREVPLGSLRDLVDVAAVAQRADGQELQALASAWGMERIWRGTDSAIEVLFFGGSLPLSVRTWARHLLEVRERSVLEVHLERHLSPFASLPPASAARELLRVFVEEIRPLPGETWRDKLVRAGRAVRQARLPMTTRGRGLGTVTPLAPTGKMSPDAD